MVDKILQYVCPAAEFIWADEEKPSANSYYLFRREFSSEGFHPPFTLHVSAIKKYRLYLNGRLIGQGPPPAAPYANILDSYTVEDFISADRQNCLAAEVQNMNGSQDACFIAWITDAHNKVLLSGGKESWHVLRAPMWSCDTQHDRQNSNVSYQEHYDARLCPEGWTLPGFDGSYWNRAKTAAPLPLIKRDIPFLPEEKVYAHSICYVEEALSLENRVRGQDLSIALSLAGKPVENSLVEFPENLLGESGASRFGSSTAHQSHTFLMDGYYDPCIVLDFGKVMTGYIEFDMEGPGGTMVDVGYAERLVDGHFVNSIETLHCSSRYILREGRQQYRFFAWESFRFVKLRFRDCFSPITVYSLHALRRTYPYQLRGSFKSGDDRLDKLFSICRHTLRLCSNDYIMDTPWREQSQWCGDTCAVLLGGIYACFGDTKLPGKFLHQTGLVQLPHGLIKFTTQSWDNGDWRASTIDYSLWWADALWNHYEYTGDMAWIHRYWPHVCKLAYALADQLDEHGLLGNLPYKAFIDWALIDGVDWMKSYVAGENAFLNAQFYGVADKMIRMAELMNDTHMSGVLKDIRAGIKAAFNSRFFDNEKGCYVDANFNGRLSRRVSEHSNMAAILWGLCTGDEAEAVINHLFVEKKQEFTMAEPFAAAFTLRALDLAGHHDLAYKIIHERWCAWMVDKGAASTFEEWGMNGSWRLGYYTSVMRSISHAWSAGPAQFMIQNTIGLQILEPGCMKIKLKPKDIGTDYRIECPIPQGNIAVKWEKGSFTINAPEGVEVIS